MIGNANAIHLRDGARSCSEEVIQLDLFDYHTAPGGNWNTITSGSQNSTVVNLIDFISGAATVVSYNGVGWGTFRRIPHKVKMKEKDLP